MVRHISSQRTLIRLFLQIVALWIVVWGLSWWHLSQVWQLYTRPYHHQWAILSATVLLYNLGVLWRYLPNNHRQGETAVLPTLGWGNHLSLMRGLAIALVSGFIFSPWPTGWYAWLPMILYTIADVADYFDGYIARRTNHATPLGEQLDIEFDGLGMLIVTLLGIWYGQLPWWYLSLGLARYLFLLGIWWRRRQGKPIYDLPASPHRRLFAGFQMGFMSVVLWPIVPAAGATIAGTLYAIPTALGFMRDWLITSGQLPATNPTYQRLRRQLVVLTRHYLPLLFRPLLLSGIFLIYAAESWLTPTSWVQLFATWGWPSPIWPVAIFRIIGITATITAVLGILPRLSTLALLFPIGFAIITSGINWLNGITLATTISLMLLSSGPYSLWPAEERYVLQRQGSVS